MVTLREAFERFKEARVVDLTHQINENSPHFPALFPCGPGAGLT